MPQKLVLADYFLGFATRSVSGGARPWRLYYESEEEAGLTPPECDAAFSGDLYINGDIKDIASTYYPAIGPYDTTDPNVAEFHVLLAKAAGIDGFMAEFTIGQEASLLNLVQAATKHDFRIGVNWINQSHFGENVWGSRDEAIRKAHDVVRWLADNVYRPCGVKLDDRYLLLIFLAHPREPAQPFDRFFSPAEVDALKRTAIQAGFDAQFFVLPWENLSTNAPGRRVWDGYFPWVWSSSGQASTNESGFSRITTREQYLERLRAYYDMAARMKGEGRIGSYIGAVCPGFDDHKGQAWGEGLKRYLPRDGGQTLKDTWALLKKSDVDAALIITWNDWVESSQIEPSLELGYAELEECARQIADWRGLDAPPPPPPPPPPPESLQIPHRLLLARLQVARCAKAGVVDASLTPVRSLLDQAAREIALTRCAGAVRCLANAESQLATLAHTLTQQSVHLFWEHGFVSHGIDAIGDPNFDCGCHLVGFAVSDELRPIMRAGGFVGRLCFEYLDVGADFVRVLVDASDPAHQVIASFKKRHSGKWTKVSLDLVHARFAGGLPGGADVQISQRTGTAGGVRMLRIDGISESVHQS